jgi:hypothetical protein
MATFKTVTVRTTLDEAKIIQRGAAALGISPSTLVSTAALSAAHRLGFYEDRVEGSRTPPGSWPDKPNRGEVSTATRIVISINPLEFEAVHQAAQWSFVSFPLFLIGSTMRFLANRKKAEPHNAKLAALQLPTPFE